MNRPRFRRRLVPASAPGHRAAVAVVMPAPQPGEWELFRPAPPAEGAAPPLARHGAAPGTRQVFATLEALAANLEEVEPLVLTLPLEMGLIQRLSLPPAEPGELREMALIQLEKILPYAVDGVGVAIQEVARTATEVIVAVETVAHDRLLALCQPLIARGCYPARTMFHAVATASTAPAGESSALLYRAAGRYVLGVCEGGRLSFAQGLGAQTPEELSAELPAVLLGAELEGVPTNLSLLRLDERAADAREVLRAALGIPVETFDAEAAASRAGAAGAWDSGDLSPPGWRAERVRGEKLARLRRRIVVGVGIYLGLLLLGFVALGAMRLRVGWQRARLEKLRPQAAYSQQADARWQVFAPAVDPARSVAETFFQVYQCLPTDGSVLLTAYDQTLDRIELQGEAQQPSQADDFIVKLKARPELRIYRFEAEPPAILPGGHTRFRITGTLPSAGAAPR